MTARKVHIGPPEWVPLNAAFERIVDAQGSRELAAGELHQALLDGRLKSGAVQLPPSTPGQQIAVPVDGQCHRTLKPTFWRQFKLSAVDNKVRCWPPGQLSGCWYFFVRRADLDKLYARDQSSRSGAGVPPRRPGQPPKHDWRLIDVEIVRRCIDPKTRRLNVPTNERQLTRDMLDWCEMNGVAPAESSMREAVKRICASLRRE